MYREPALRAAGDQAVSVEFSDKISQEANACVRALAHLIEQRAVPGIVETVPSFCSLLVCYDPLVLSWATLTSTLRTLIGEARRSEAGPSRGVEIPCCYGGDLGVDLVSAAVRLELAPEEVAHIHASDEYLVYFVGFTPGLPYMGVQSARLRLPRLDTPRTKVPAGSVGIGGGQCCIYPIESPGGYWILGRTPVRLYDPARADPILLRAGDRVRFRAIDRGEFDGIAAAVAVGRFSLRVDS